MSNYPNFFKDIEEIRKKNEVIFRMSIDYLFEVGYRHMDKESMEETRKLVVEKEKENIKNKVISFMTPEFTISIMETALELKEFPKWDLLYYISKKMKMS